MRVSASRAEEEGGEEAVASPEKLGEGLAEC